MDGRDEFWRWFVQHENELYSFEGEAERLFDEVAAALQRVNPDLTFEFGPRSEKREFVVSAGGVKQVFPAVASLVVAAPKLTRWNVTAFRPRRPLPVSVEFQGVSVNSKDVQFSLLDNGKTAGIHLFIPNFREEDVNLKQIGYLLLDDVLGEFDVEMKLGLIKMLSPDSPTKFKRFPISELPSRFDQLNHQLEGLSGQSS